MSEANEVKPSQTLVIASFRFASFASDIVYLILHDYLCDGVPQEVAII